MQIWEDGLKKLDFRPVIWHHNQKFHLSGEEGKMEIIGAVLILAGAYVVVIFSLLWIFWKDEREKLREEIKKQKRLFQERHPPVINLLDLA
ncbi:MAG: hypothetical protein Q8R12_01440 [bacterium]|nr:hypothetical protein [bacterium]